MLDIIHFHGCEHCDQLVPRLDHCDEEIQTVVYCDDCDHMDLRPVQTTKSKSQAKDGK